MKGRFLLKHNFMKVISKFILVKTIFLLLFAIQVKGQEKVELLTAKEQETVVNSICSKLSENYVFPDVAIKMVSSIKSKHKNGDYNSILDPKEFAAKLTADLRIICNDKHVIVNFAPDRVAEQQQTITAEDKIASLNRRVNKMKRKNFGFKEVKILAGNIGYVDIRGFSDPEYAEETVASVMKFLSNSDAIIFDLRNSGGGLSTMVQLLTSYLYGNDPIQLNSIYSHPSDSTVESWTLPKVSGTKMPDIPVYVLTSGTTFSAAEAFCYNLKHLKRATLIGATTYGGAHPSRNFVASERFMVWVPTGRAINPITKSNWEGTGVIPHIEVPIAEALDVAYKTALESLLKTNKNKDFQASYEWPLVALNLKTNPVTLDAKKLKTFVGNYGPRKVFFENGRLFYQRDRGVKYELVPYSDHEFMLKGDDDFRIRFLAEGNTIVALEGLYEGGRTNKNAKEKE